MNTTLTLNSIKFKNPLPRDAYIHLSIQTSLTHYQTLKLTYTPKCDTCIYSEIIPLILNNNISSDYLIFDVIMTESLPYNRSQSIGKKTLHAAELFAQNEKTIQKSLIIEIGNNNEATINIDYYPLYKLQQDLNLLNINCPQPLNTQEKLQNLFLEFKDELHKMGEKDIDSDLKILQLGEVYRNFIKNFTFMVYLYNWSLDILYWRQPSYTIIFGLISSIFIVNPSISITLICLAMLFSYNNVQKFALKLSYDSRHGDTTDQIEFHRSKFRQYKNNMTVIQEFMNLSNRMNDCCQNILKNEDKTILLMIIERLRVQIFTHMKISPIRFWF